jgi:isopenicillin-N N-acyltransferase-like protein
MSWRRLVRGLAWTMTSILVLLVVAHFGVGMLARLTPPATEIPAKSDEVTTGAQRRVGRATAEQRDGLWVVHLSGAPDEIGWSHSRLLRDEMVANEGVLLGELSRTVRPAPARWLLLDLAQLRYRNVDRGMSEERRREIAAEALGFAPDPYSDVFPTYQRFVYLNALYDIALSFERSPLIGCTTFTFSKEAAAGGHTLLARAFDFEVNDIFDEKKAVFFVSEDGAIPFASVAWPGLVGVVSGMNREGVAVVVHGGRAGEPRSVGEPVVHGLRRVLSRARTVNDAVRLLTENPPMVSHIVIAADASGETVAIERVPGALPFVRHLATKAVVTNHFQGPSAGDPKNAWVREHTSTLPREERGKELLAAIDHPATVETAVELLRDRKGAGGSELPLGDRRAIDALIATHGVVFDTKARRLWVSVAPHLLGRFVGFDLAVELGAPTKGEPPPVVPADPLLTSGEYQRMRPHR